MIELKNSKTQYLGGAAGRERYSLDAFIGAVQMREPGGQWQNIGPRLTRDADGWHVEGAPYYAEVKDDGSRLFCPDRNERGKYLRLPAPPLFTGLEKNIVQNPAKLGLQMLPNQITMPVEWGEIRVIFGNTGMHFEIFFIKDPPSVVFGKDSPGILLDVETAGLDIEQLLNSREGLGIPRPRLMADSPELIGFQSQEKWLDWHYKNGQLELGFDFAGLPFPLLLKNTTIDVQVGASADDGWIRSTSSYSSTGELRVGRWDSGGGVYHSWARFTGITVPQSSNINAAFLTVYEGDTLGNPLTKIYADDQHNPSPVSSNADYWSRTLTTAGADEDGEPGDYGWHDTGSIAPVIQELVNSYDYSDGAVQIMWKDDGSAAGNNIRKSLHWDYADHSYGAKLHIEYTSGGITARTADDSGTGADARLSFFSSLTRGDAGGGGEVTIGKGLAMHDQGSAVDVMTDLVAAVLAAETGSGIEASTLASLVNILSTETCSGNDTAALVAVLSAPESGLGVDIGWLIGLKTILSGDSGVAADALKALVGISGGTEMKLPGRQGRVKIPSRGMNL
jgi:hypothetical protein